MGNSIPEVKQGTRVLPIDFLGNLIGVLQKLILFHWKVKRHRITAETELTVIDYLKSHAAELGNLVVQLNRYAPQDSFRRLFKNDRVAWPYRFTLGLLTVLLADVLLIDRIFGGDRYNPFTHTVHLHSDLPSIALHELGHAKDFSRRRWRGSYAVFRLFPLVDVVQEYEASQIALRYSREMQLRDIEIEAYKILYPAFGTYAGSYFLGGMGSVPCALIGHIVGRVEASSRRRQFELQDQSRAFAQAAMSVSS